MKKKYLSLFVILSLIMMSCGNDKLENEYSNLVGIWTCEDSNEAISINSAGFIHFFTRMNGIPGKLSGRGIIFNDKKIVFLIIIIPKTLHITTSLKEIDGELCIGFEEKKFIRTSIIPYESMGNSFNGKR